MTYRVTVDADVCISSGKCVADEPDVFRFDDDEVAELVPGAPDLADRRLVEVARNCPSGAIQVFDGDTEIDVL